MKRFFELTLSIITLLCLSPLLILTALAIKLDSGGPVLFKQSRVGLNGNLFSIYKFRSMVDNASDKGPHFTSMNDKRITRVGAFIRKTSLDELPQIFNVISGDMAIVGPRPNVPAQKSEYTNSQWEKRNSVKPGITGLAQAMLRSEATPEQRTSLDLEYVDKASLTTDFKIILLTIRQVIFKGGN